jgi:hypothetical protein
MAKFKEYNKGEGDGFLQIRAVVNLMNLSRSLGVHHNLYVRLGMYSISMYMLCTYINTYRLCMYKLGYTQANYV